MSYAVNKYFKSEWRRLIICDQRQTNTQLPYTRIPAVTQNLPQKTKIKRNKENHGQPYPMILSMMDLSGLIIRLV